MSDPCPAFDPASSKYDQGTYKGRLQHFMEMVNPRTLLTTDDELKDAQSLLAQFDKTKIKPAGVTDEAMWHAKKVKDAVIHPVTGENMFLLGRMSAFVPVNTVPTAMMLMASTTPQVLAAQWFNQTVNVMVNYVNRSGAECDWQEMGQAYGLAVGVSCSIAIGAGKLIKSGPPIIKRLGLAVPYLAVISAGGTNVAMSRMPEMQKGVTVVDKEGNAVGISKAAAIESVKFTILSRCVFLPMMPMLLPPIVMGALGPMIAGAGAAVAVTTECCVIAACIGLGLPLAIAVFPQEMALDVTSLEPEFQSLTDSSGTAITELYCNKGL